MNSKRKQTEQWVIDYQNGMTQKQIGDLNNISSEAVGQRFKRLGVSRVYRTKRPETINKTRLEYLYQKEELPIPKIAKHFGVTKWVITNALNYYQIPKRPRIKKPGRNVDLLRKLEIGESLEFEYTGKNPRSVFRAAAKTLDIEIFFQSLGSDKFKVTRIIDAGPKLTKVDRINKHELENLYLIKRLPISEIEEALGCNEQIIYRALKFYKLPPRKRPASSGGKIIDLLRKMSVGETIEFESKVKYPVTNLHTIARRARVKISIRRLKNSLFSITKVSDVGGNDILLKK